MSSQWLLHSSLSTGLVIAEKRGPAGEQGPGLPGRQQPGAAVLCRPRVAACLDVERELPLLVGRTVAFGASVYKYVLPKVHGTVGAGAAASGPAPAVSWAQVQVSGHRWRCLNTTWFFSDSAPFLLGPARGPGHPS